MKNERDEAVMRHIEAAYLADYARLLVLAGEPSLPNARDHISRVGSYREYLRLGGMIASPAFVHSVLSPLPVLK